jgi:hypothetical protein
LEPGASPFRVIASIQKRVQFVMKHGDRIICDDWVYQKKINEEYDIIQSLERFKGVSTGVQLSLELICLAHPAQLRISLWRWQGNEYVNVATQALLGRPGGGGTPFGVGPASTISLMSKVPFVNELNEVYCVMYGNELYKFKVFMKELESQPDNKEQLCKKNLINRFDKCAPTDRIVNYSHLGPDHLVILYSHKLTVMKVGGSPNL